MTNLKYLNASNCNITNYGLRGCSNLEILIARNNYGITPDVMNYCKKIKYIEIPKTKGKSAIIKDLMKEPRINALIQKMIIISQCY